MLDINWANHLIYEKSNNNTLGTLSSEEYAKINKSNNPSNNSSSNNNPSNNNPSNNNPSNKISPTKIQLIKKTNLI